jgi:hypothetical protein
MQTLKELYLTVFVLFFRFAKQSWSNDMNAWKATAAVTLVQWTLLGAAILWIAAFAGYSHLSGISRLSFFAVFLITYLFNYRTLVAQGYGSQFEQQFGQFGTRKKTVLIIAGLAIVVFSFAFAFATVVALRPK